MDATEMTLTTFAAPMLKTDEILLCLNECGIHMSEAELGEPQRHKDQIKGVFLSLLVRWFFFKYLPDFLSSLRSIHYNSFV